jgi:hypothetical protein
VIYFVRGQSYEIDHLFLLLVVVRRNHLGYNHSG